MADDCDLEELTAFLEASDNELEDTGGNTEKPVDDKTETTEDKKDDCSLEEIEAFLQGSDDDSDSDNENPSEKVKTANVDVDKNDDLKQDSFDDEIKTETKDGHVVNGDHHKYSTDVKPALADEEAEFDDFDDADMAIVDQMMNESMEYSKFKSVSPGSEKCDEDSENVKSFEDDASKQNDEKLTDEVPMEDDDASDDDVANDDNVGGKCDDNDDDNSNTVIDIDKEKIKAEMAAMAERMKQLESLLNQSPSSATPCKSKSEKPEKQDHKHSDKSPRSGHSERKSHHKSPSGSSGGRHSSYSDRKHKHKHDSDKSTPSRDNRHKSSSNNKNFKQSDKQSTPQSDKKHRPSEKHSSGGDKKQILNEHKKNDKDSYSNKLAMAMFAHKKSKSTASSGSKSTEPLGSKSLPSLGSTLSRVSSSPHTGVKKSNPSSLFEKKQADTNRTKSNTLSGMNTDEENPFFAHNEPTPQATSTTSSDNTGLPTEPEVDARALFGESDDSDWDDLGGEEKGELSKEGKEIHKLIVQGQRKREARSANYDTSVLKKPNLSKWSDKPRPPISLHPLTGGAGASRSSMSKSAAPQRPALNPETGTVSGKYKLKDEYMPKSTIVKEDERESVTDPFCGIRIINPRISMSGFKAKMEGRNMIRIPKLLARYNKSDLQKDNWVTLGVVVHKTEPRQSAAGKSYCIWKLSDLQDCDKTVTFFLFGNIYKEHWKNDLGVVIGLLNPTFMDKAEKNQSEVAMTIQHPQQLLMLGISKDLGQCRSTTKSGQPCSSFINKQQGEYCTYHVQSAYRKSSSKRTELQATTGATPKNFAMAKKLQAKQDGFFFYGGNTYTSMKPQAKSSTDKMTLKKLQTFEAGKSAGKITTMSLHELEAEDHKKIKKIAEKDKQLLSLLSVPSAGSMNFVKHLVKKDATKSFVKDGSEEDAPIVSAKDLLKEHTQTIIQKKRETALLSVKPTIGKGFTCGQQISLDVPVKKKTGSASAEFAKQLAIAKIKAKGGLKSEDPNAVRKKVVSPEAREKIKKRVAGAMESEPSPAKDSESREPPKKKSKLLGDLDLNSPEVQQLLKKKSKHTGALAEAEAEHEDRYFSALEKKEKMEDKMKSIMKVDVKLVYCCQCKYKYFSAHERCKKENHPLKYINGVKRFFSCKQCKKRTVCLDKFPTSACEQCGSMNYVRESMFKEKKGPKLESEELCLRGNEQKFIGSLQGKASFNG